MRKIVYFYYVDELESLGVIKKINGTVKGLQQLGYLCYAENINIGLIKGLLKFIRTDADLLFIRFSFIAFIFLWFPMLLLRLLGKKIIVDVPSPRIVMMREFFSQNKGLSYRIKQFILILGGGWILWPANAVIQYSYEHPWFEFGLKKKTLLLGNGYDINNTIPLAEPNYDCSRLHLIAVAHFQDWHGYDRVFEALAKLTAAERGRITLSLVGNGPLLADYKEHCCYLGIEEVVSFYGKVSGLALDSIFDGQDFGLSSLGLFRKNLSLASDLKTREYFIRGLPVIAAGQDTDFEDGFFARFQVKNEEEEDSLLALFRQFLKQKPYFDRKQIRAEAENRISFKSKMKRVLSFIGEM